MLEPAACISRNPTMTTGTPLHVRRQLVVLADTRTVRIVDGPTVVATHMRSCADGQRASRRRGRRCASGPRRARRGPSWATQVGDVSAGTRITTPLVSTSSTPSPGFCSALSLIFTGRNAAVTGSARAGCPSSRVRHLNRRTSAIPFRRAKSAGDHHRRSRFADRRYAWLSRTNCSKLAKNS